MAAKKFFKTKEEKKVLSPCEQCKLNTVCISPKLRPEGKGRLGIAIIIDKPYSSMDKAGTLAGGAEYTFLKNTLNKIGIDLEEDCWLIPVVSCRTPKDRLPTSKEVKFCKERFTRVMERLNPNVIIPMGKIAFDAVVGSRVKGRLTGTGWEEFINCVIPDQELGKFIAPNYSIETMLETKTYADSGYTSKPLYMRDKAWYNLWKDNFYKACSHWDKRVEVLDYTSMCQITEDIDQAIDWITEAMEWEEVSFDVEANAKKLHRKGSKIYCVSISNGEVSYAFPIFSDPTFQKVWRRFMESSIKKIAHNLQYENEASKNCLGYWVKNWYWDTMLGAHIEHNQQKTGLKFQTYTRFGVLGYDDSCDQYITKTDEDESIYGDNCFNNIHLAPMNELLLYNALDSLFTHRLYKLQLSALTPEMTECAKFYARTAVTMSKVTNTGLPVSDDGFQAATEKLDKMIQEARDAIMACDEVKLWDGENEFNFNSTTQLGHLLFDIMGVKPLAYTDTGKPSLDKDTIEKMKLPILEKIVDYREATKLKATYIDGWRREAIDGFVHSQFMLNTTDTGRSSSTSPNSQNQVKRNKEFKKIVRTPITAPKGFRIVELDFSGQETYTNLFYSGDPAYKKYLSDPNSDMHRQLASQLLVMPETDITKEWRQQVKSQTFAMMYGSWYRQVAIAMWEWLQKQPELMKHFASKGITTYAQYEKICEKAEKYFWTDMFGVHDRWRKEQFEKYQKQGYLDYYTGFRIQAPMDRKCTFNYPPQGSGAQITFWVMNHMQDKIEELNLKSRMIGTIHDSIVFMVAEEEAHLIDHWVHEFACVRIQEEWNWITLPMVMEKDRSEIGGSWANMEECGRLDGDLVEPENTP